MSVFNFTTLLPSRVNGTFKKKSKSLIFYFKLLRISQYLFQGHSGELAESHTGVGQSPRLEVHGLLCFQRADPRWGNTGRAGQDLGFSPPSLAILPQHYPSSTTTATTTEQPSEKPQSAHLSINKSKTAPVMFIELAESCWNPMAVGNSSK